MVIYICSLALAIIAVKYFFKTNIADLTPSFAFLGIFLLSLVAAGFTEDKSHSVLFKIWNAIVLIAVVVSIAMCLKLKVPVSALLLSLLFQVPYCLALYYYGGIIFTHKFD